MQDKREYVANINTLCTNLYMLFIAGLVVVTGTPQGQKLAMTTLVLGWLAHASWSAGWKGTLGAICLVLFVVVVGVYFYTAVAGY